MNRRSFIKQAGLGVAAGTALVGAPAMAQSNPKIKWRMASSYPQSLATLFGSTKLFVEYVKEATGGNFEIQLSPPGEIVPALQVMDAVSNGTVEAGHTASYYYFGKNPVYCFETAVPFGLTQRQMSAWYHEGNGKKFINEMFDPLNIVHRPLGNTAMQMGGWYRKEVNSLADLKGLKMRISGLAGEVMHELGVLPQQLAGSDIYPALEKGSLDAVEFVGPADDERLGFYKVAKYYYYPGFWEAGPNIAAYFNKDSFNKLPASYQRIIDMASMTAHIMMINRYDTNNPMALRRLIANGAILREFPKEILDAAWEASKRVMKRYCDKDPFFKTVHDDYFAFRNDLMPWFNAVEGSYVRYVSSKINQDKAKS